MVLRTRESVGYPPSFYRPVQTFYMKPILRVIAYGVKKRTLAVEKTFGRRICDTPQVIIISISDVDN